MGFSREVVFLFFLLLLHLLQGSDTSLVKLNENGYEDIIIAIDPAVPEDVTIIEHIKADVKFTQCGEKAENTSTSPLTLGKVLVHEWAHHRWGVFDEYNEDQPFYSASSKKIEATRVTEFCRKENHNREAPTLHNMKCNYRSTWEVISSSEDFKNSAPMEGPPPPPFF
ncbi:Chloride channel accessory 4B [Apodemus speciosus]|uniref:Chloride channel accessory 4B n=1 Tax=Apodemus speciosus TaxID=105296 RepID=A0ABQ0EN54_APOSI